MLAIFQGLQNGAIRGLQNGAGFGDCKSGQEALQIGAKRYKIGAEITNWGLRDFKPGQGLQIGAEQVVVIFSGNIGGNILIQHTLESSKKFKSVKLFMPHSPPK